jgi:hypothetical protein
MRNDTSTPGTTASAAYSALASSRPRWLDRAAFAAFLVSVSLCSLIAGAYLVESETPLYDQTLGQAFRGLRALHADQTEDWTIDGWYVARDQRSGVVTHDESRCDKGLTLFTSLGKPSSAELVDMQGQVVHKWQLPFREAYPAAPHLSRSHPEERIHWRRVKLFPDGDLLADYTGIADTPNGYGLVKVDRNSRLLWKYEDCAHHDFDVGPDGRIYTLVHHIRQEPLAATPHLRTPTLEDFIVVLSPEGKELRRVSIFEAFAAAGFAPYLESMDSNQKGDHTHANTVDFITPEYAAHHPYCRAGDVMVSLRNPHLLAIVNLERGEVVWAARGIWERQHDCDPLPSGNILLFDNQGRRAAGGRSRILEWNPSTGAIAWEFAGSAERPFESLARGSQQLLRNGNVLITESNNGRLLEVARDGQIVWEFINPDRFEGRPDRIAVVCSAVRYRRDELTFLGPSRSGQVAVGKTSKPN